jgi:hypothetical protein
MTRSTLCAKRSVSISPGLMALTRTLCEMPVYAIDLVKISNATMTDPSRDPMPTIVTMLPLMSANAALRREFS